MEVKETSTALMDHFQPISSRKNKRDEITFFISTPLTKIGTNTYVLFSLISLFYKVYFYQTPCIENQTLPDIFVNSLSLVYEFSQHRHSDNEHNHL